MNELLFMLLALITGGTLGMLFFGGLWFTVRKAMASTIPAVWFFGSLTLRTGIVLVGFYLVMHRANWLDGLVCLLGFIAARLIVFRLTQAYELDTEPVTINLKEAIHEA